jgi:hypothetical protein
MSKIAEKFTTLDISLAAYLEVSDLPAELEFFKGRVIFTFPADDRLYKLLKGFNSNAAVQITDYVTVLRTLKGRLLAMKTSHRIGEKEESLTGSLSGSLKEKKGQL